MCIRDSVYTDITAPLGVCAEIGNRYCTETVKIISAYYQETDLLVARCKRLKMNLVDLVSAKILNTENCALSIRL